MGLGSRNWGLQLHLCTAQVSVFSILLCLVLREVGGYVPVIMYVGKTGKTRFKILLWLNLKAFYMFPPVTLVLIQAFYEIEVGFAIKFRNLMMTA